MFNIFMILIKTENVWNKNFSKMETVTKPRLEQCVLAMMCGIQTF